VYFRSLLVVALCTVFVIGYAATLVFVTSGVETPGNHATSAYTQASSCQASNPSCVTISITSSRLSTVNYTDELGPVNYAVLTLGLEASGSGPVLKAGIFLNGTSVGTIQGPFEPGVVRVVNQTLPATVSVVPGKPYLVTVEGFYGDGAEVVWASVEVVAH
jgi:hypothetical protein